ncbi:uncharacterized protein LOC134254025 isoform X3 [Saccostrea cucullata]|uniref:uncharacterized protein LOC134254025 isoform X3 n=1 Tax=Saccostrea cuccullata TaxID=36930 RepID=UPI002ED412D8
MEETSSSFTSERADRTALMDGIFSTPKKKTTYLYAFSPIFEGRRRYPYTESISAGHPGSKRHLRTGFFHVPPALSGRIIIFLSYCDKFFMIFFVHISYNLDNKNEQEASC